VKLLAGLLIEDRSAKEGGAFVSDRAELSAGFDHGIDHPLKRPLGKAPAKLHPQREAYLSQ
jgi:hypothetical protein